MPTSSVPNPRSQEQAKKRKQLSSPITTYLVIYNILQFVGWTIVGVLSIAYVLKKKSYFGVWNVTQIWLKIFQTAALLEVVHAAIRIVPSNPVMALFQISSRVLVVWGITDCVKEAQLSVGVPLLLFTWTVTEMVRYSYYVMNLLSFVPSFLTWCRYTFFIILYPCGITGELLCMYAALPVIKATKLYTVDLPNRANFSFNYYYCIILIMLSYIPLFPMLYLHMCGQRKKVLTPSVKKHD